ncbi:hypothetical protein EIP91_006006 [Steccherinum ochraceum]|uniref:G protein-coupled receptor n=1 Tax=Steccherinum ochraceum TaxID=92696 RepID=A0A4R0R6P6_9APHY|nr:hypothetical protein EIP91_006006 [Steccherinum ochraceum]
MRQQLPLDVAQLAGLFTECILYGIFLVTFAMCVKALFTSALPGRLKRYLLIVATLLLFIFATMDVAFGLRHILDAFVYYTGPGGPIAELSRISYWVNVMKGVNYNCQTSTADAILIYRCFMLYGRKWRYITGLMIFWAAGLFSEFATVYTEITLRQSATLDAARLTPWITSMLAITLTLNLLATGMIVLRIWAVERISSKSGLREFPQSYYGSSGGSLKFAMLVIVESGAIYSGSVLVFFVSSLLHSNAQYIASHAVVPIIGITFNLIIIRLQTPPSQAVTLVEKGELTLGYDARTELRAIQIWIPKDGLNPVVQMLRWVS